MTSGAVRSRRGTPDRHAAEIRAPPESDDLTAGRLAGTITALPSSGTRVDMETGVNILVVDDEPAMRRLEARWIEGVGHRCHQAASAAEALELLEAEPVDLVVLDIGLPDQSGLRLARTVSELHPAIPIVMATAVADFAAAAEAMRAGAVDHLVKPFQTEHFLAAIDRGLSRRSVSHPLAVPPDAIHRPPPAALPDVPAAAGAAIDELFRAMCVAGASDLHVSVGLPPMVRKDGQMLPLDAGAAPYDVGTMRSA